MTYSVSLPDANECTIPDVCPPNFQCKNLPQTYSCECKGGFKYEIKGKGPHKKCVGKHACTIAVQFSDAGGGVRNHIQLTLSLQPLS